MLICNQKELKALVSGLRRELKERFNEGSAPSHSQMLDILARALGYPAAPALLSKLPQAEARSEESASGASRPEKLVNFKGELDLVKPGEAGVLVQGHTFEPMTGTLEDIFSCLAGAASVTRKRTGNLDVEYDGETEVNWDEQETRRDANGFMYWLDESGSSYSSADCILVPVDFDPEAQTLPVRQLLVDVYQALISKRGQVKQVLDESRAQTSVTLSALAEDVGFALTSREQDSLCALLAARD